MLGTLLHRLPPPIASFISQRDWRLVNREIPRPRHLILRQHSCQQGISSLWTRTPPPPPTPHHCTCGQRSRSAKQLTNRVNSQKSLPWVILTWAARGPGWGNLFNPFRPDCKTIFSRILKHFSLYFSIFKTWAWLLCQIHILFLIKNH